MFTSRKLKKIKNLIIKNGGATLDGQTLKPATFKRGYMVSIKGTESQLNINNLKIKVIKQYQKQAKQKRGCVGFWLDNNILYLDISKHYVSKDKACKNAIKNNQLALYDIYNNKSIYTKDFKYKTEAKTILTF